MGANIDFNRPFQNERTSERMSFRFGFRRPKGGSTLRHFNARGRQSRPCAIPGLRPGIYAPLGARPRRAVFSFDSLHLLGIPAAGGGLHPSGLKTPQNPASCGVFYYFSRLSRSIRLIYCWVNCSSPDMAGETAWLFFHASTVPDSRGGERGINFRPSYVQFSLILR